MAIAFKWGWKGGDTPARYAVGLKAMGVRMVRTTFAGVQAIAVAVENDLTLNTPRFNPANDPLNQRGHTDHVADGWTHQTVEVNPSRLVIEVYNKNPRFNAPLPAGGGTTTLGEILEYGSRPHTIEPKKPGGMLVFFWPAVGHVVRLRKVNHPGTRPYGMMAGATEVAIRDADNVLARASAIMKTANLKRG